MKKARKIRTILVPIDYSETSKHGLENATRIATRTGARLALLHVIVLQGAYDALYVPENLWSEDTLRGHHRKLEELGRISAPDLGVTTSVTIHPVPMEAILEEAEKIGADLIVMGTHARHGLAHFFLGSTAEEVVRHATCPVMTVGPGPAADQQAA